MNKEEQKLLRNLIRCDALFGLWAERIVSAVRDKNDDPSWDYLSQDTISKMYRCYKRSAFAAYAKKACERVNANEINAFEYYCYKLIEGDCGFCGEAQHHRNKSNASDWKTVLPYMFFCYVVNSDVREDTVQKRIREGSTQRVQELFCGTKDIDIPVVRKPYMSGSNLYDELKEKVMLADTDGNHFLHGIFDGDVELLDILENYQWIKNSMVVIKISSFLRDIFYSLLESDITRLLYLYILNERTALVGRLLPIIQKDDFGTLLMAEDDYEIIQRPEDSLIDCNGLLSAWFFLQMGGNAAAGRRIIAELDDEKANLIKLLQKNEIDENTVFSLLEMSSNQGTELMKRVIDYYLPKKIDDFKKEEAKLTSLANKVLRVLDSIREIEGERVRMNMLHDLTMPHIVIK